MLQSEYDAIMRRKRLKIILIILTAIAVAVVVFIVIKAGKEEVSIPEVATPKAGEEKPSPVSREENTDQSQSVTMPPGDEFAPTNKAESVQQQSSIGTLSVEEERDRLREIGKSIPVPPPPPTVKK